MSNDKWRFDPNEDYTRDDYYEGGRPHGRKGISGMKNSKQHHNENKFNSKRMKKDHRRNFRDNDQW